MARRPVVGVMGGGSVPETIEEQARELGAAVARRGWVLLNGGRDAGVMRASAEGAAEEDGLVVGVLPGTGGGDVASGIDVAVFTGLGEGRNHVNVLSSDVAVCLPGGAGTLSEAALAVKTGTPLVLVGWPDEDVPPTLAGAAQRVASVEAALETLDERLPP